MATGMDGLRKHRTDEKAQDEEGAGEEHPPSNMTGPGAPGVCTLSPAPIHPLLLSSLLLNVS